MHRKCTLGEWLPVRKRLANNKKAALAAQANKPAYMILLAGLFVVMGTILYLQTKAAVQTNAFEAEIGALSNTDKAAVIADAGAANGSAVRLNKSATGGGVLGLDAWTYIQADGNRQSENYLWGLGLGDVNGDGFADIVAGKELYVNKATGDITGSWSKSTPFSNAYLVINIDGDATGDVIDLGGSPRWLEWDGGNMAVRASGSGPGAQQGAAYGEVLGGGTPEVVYSGEESVYLITFSGSSMSVSQIGSNSSDEGVAIGDFNKDGKPDVAANDGKNAIWFENNGTTSNWTRHVVGAADRGSGDNAYTDKVGAADINGDGLTDILLTEEIFDSGAAKTYWWKNPGTSGVTSQWPQRTTIASQDSTNSMSIADMDNDGDLDVITGEKFGDLEAVVWENDGTGLQWTKHQIAIGHENHGGTQVKDLDNDGDLDVVSIGYDTPQYLHIYRNDAIVD